MSSRRDAERERERDRARVSQQQAQARTNEYFVSKDGIDREVITADVCRYLGNDALVRPGQYEDPQTRQVRQGYYITAYRNLTSAMIADLKADSDRWEAERRATASRGQPSNGIPLRDSNGVVRKSNTPVVEYRASTTHQSRQYYGPTEAVPTGAPLGYPPTSSGGPAPYDNAYQQPAYNQQAQYPPSSQYASDSGYPAYIATGAELGVERGGAMRPPNPPAAPNQGIPRQYAGSTPTYSQQPDSRAPYYPNQPPVSSSQGYAQQQPLDPYYGRAPATYGDSTPDPYDGRFQDPTPYSQAPISSSSSTTATSGPSRRDRDRDDRDRHGRRHGR